MEYTNGSKCFFVWALICMHKVEGVLILECNIESVLYVQSFILSWNYLHRIQTPPPPSLSLSPFLLLLGCLFWDIIALLPAIIIDDIPFLVLQIKEILVQSDVSYNTLRFSMLCVHLQGRNKMDQIRVFYILLFITILWVGSNDKLVMLFCPIRQERK